MTAVLKDLSDALAAAVGTAAPSIVRVEGRRRLAATGIVWAAEGVIVTAHHTLERDDNINVVLHDNTALNATLIGRDPHNDLALLRVDAALTPANWASGGLRVGNLVLALGRPGPQVQATLGVVSALVGKQLEKDEGRRKRGRRHGMGRALVDGFIQTDVVMYPGFSGGPLLAGDGLVHGLNTSGFTRGISISVPVPTIRSTAETLLAHGRMKQGFLGVAVQPARLPDAVAAELGQETALLVVSVENDSPAAAAGLLVGDLLVSLDGEALQEVEELLALLSGERVGQSLPLTVARGGTVRQLSVTIGERA